MAGATGGEGRAAGDDGRAAAPDAPGWRPDPAGSALERWWDGVAWTDYTRLPPVQLPPDARRVVARDTGIRPPDDDTRELGWISWSPGWIVLVMLPLAGFSLLAAALAPVGALLIAAALCVLAVRDSRELRRRGFPRVGSWWWMLLTPVGYLWARRRALGGGSGVALGVCLVLVAVIGVGAFIYLAVSQGLGALSELSGTP